MAALLICAFILLKVVSGDTCASGKFTESGECCRACPAGFGVAAECGKEDTKCSPCPQGTFSSSEDLGRCLPCSRCPYGVPTSAACSAAEDTQCECDGGFFTQCRLCAPGTFSEEHANTKPCQTCARCKDSEVEIRACMPNSDTICMDKKLHILSRDTPSWTGVEEVTAGGRSPAPGTPKFTPQGEKGGNNILAYVSVLAAVVLGLLVYVAYKCWRSCKQKQALSKARAAELGASPEGEKLQSDSGVFLDSQSLQDNQPSKGTKRDSKQDTRLYINLPPHRQEEVERLLQEGAGRGWRQLGQALGYEAEQLDLFGRGEAPARTLLSNWALKEGSTLGPLCSALARIERPDVVSALNNPAQGVSVV
ncbi:tumor necrosis factor receptor superfamily member 16 [Syngnathoides biaculeatus]|uniref:tumor necrosis factor receptor superfamily member 16 n=1 Tax=Syngnathoides biaculeatus TaxID=300417 RepID=UPI002ADD5C2C|nr:tumor necrosis factor receptor superfamily member 16 [Syngnathoides biaculeatus]